MQIPFLEPGQIKWLSGAVAEYIFAQRARYSSRAIPLTSQQQASMNGFFHPAVLTIHTVTLQDERVANPHFYSELEALGFFNLPNQSGMGAITFSDVIVSHVPFDNGSLFHELVHVEQYRQLGVERFAELYVRGFLSGGSYDCIPLEQHAYELGARYEGNLQQLFSVEEEVRKYIQRQAY